MFLEKPSGPPKIKQASVGRNGTFMIIQGINLCSVFEETKVECRRVGSLCSVAAHVHDLMEVVKLAY